MRCDCGMPWLGALYVAARMTGNTGLEQGFTCLHACLLE